MKKLPLLKVCLPAAAIGGLLMAVLSFLFVRIRVGDGIRLSKSAMGKAVLDKFYYINPWYRPGLGGILVSLIQGALDGFLIGILLWWLLNLIFVPWEDPALS